MTPKTWLMTAMAVFAVAAAIVSLAAPWPAATVHRSAQACVLAPRPGPFAELEIPATATRVAVVEGTSRLRSGAAGHVLGTALPGRGPTVLGLRADLRLRAGDRIIVQDRCGGHTYRVMPPGSSPLAGRMTLVTPQAVYWAR